MFATRTILPFFVIVTALVRSASALIEVGGKDPVTDHNWPAGGVDVANHASRQSFTVGPPFGGGLWTFQYRGDSAAFNAVVEKFAAVRSPDLLLVIHDGVTKSVFAMPGGTGNGSVDWSFAVWTPENFYQLYSDAENLFLSSRPEFRGPLPPPRIDVWTGGQVDWTKVKLPAGIRVVDERAASHGYTPDDGSVVVGTVYDLITSKPVVGATLVLSRYDPASPGGAAAWPEVPRVVADKDGRFEKKHVPAGSYELSVRHDGYASRIIDSAEFQGGTYKSYAVRLCPAFGQRGRVVDDKGKPLVGVKVRLDDTVAVDGTGYPTTRVNENQQATTDADGRFTLTGLPRGQAQLAASLDRYCQADPLAVVHISDQELVLRMNLAGSIHVTALDHAGKPLQGTVDVWDQRGELRGTWGGGSNLDATGKATFAEVPPGKYFVSADPAARFNKKATPQAIEVKPGETVDVELTR